MRCYLCVSFQALTVLQQYFLTLYITLRHKESVGVVMSNLCGQWSNSTAGLDLQKVATPNFIFAVMQLLFSLLISTSNGLVIASICVFRRLRTLTNSLLASLAMSDLIVAFITIPLYVSFYLTPESLLCDRLACLAWFGSVILGCGSSLLNLLVIVLDRFVAIHFPLSYMKHQTPRTVGAVLAALWVYILALSALPLMGWNHWVDDEPCNFYTTLPKAYVIWAAYLTVGTCIVSSSLLYAKIFATVRRHQRRIHAQNIAGRVESRHLDGEMKSTRLNATVFLLFVLFWSPYFCVGPLKYSSLSQEVVEIIKNGCLVLSFGNSMVNPVVYGLMQKKFSAAYRILLTTPCTRWAGLSGHILVREDGDPCLSG